VGDALRSAVTGVEPLIPVDGIQSVGSLVDYFTGRERFLASLALAFSVVAGTLALVGVFGVLSYSARQRTREIAVRIALGAAPSRVVGSMLYHGGMLVGGGILLGLAGAAATARLLQSVLFETSPAEPVVYGGVTFVLFLMGLLAGWIPARRASHTDPVTVLKEE
jgi:ABC-type antimicrobial peptide transport system permease subunit